MTRFILALLILSLPVAVGAVDFTEWRTGDGRVYRTSGSYEPPVDRPPTPEDIGWNTRGKPPSPEEMAFRQGLIVAKPFVFDHVSHSTVPVYAFCGSTGIIEHDDYVLINIDAVPYSKFPKSQFWETPWGSNLACAHKDGTIDWNTDDLWMKFEKVPTDTGKKLASMQKQIDKLRGRLDGLPKWIVFETSTGTTNLSPICEKYDHSWVWIDNSRFMSNPPPESYWKCKFCDKKKGTRITEWSE